MSVYDALVFNKGKKVRWRRDNEMKNLKIITQFICNISYVKIINGSKLLFSCENKNDYCS